jgi:hypothetical protein
MRRRKSKVPASHVDGTTGAAIRRSDGTPIKTLGGDGSIRVDKAHDQALGVYSVVAGIWDVLPELTSGHSPFVGGKQPRRQASGNHGLALANGNGKSQGETEESVPYWDAKKHELWLDGAVVKQYFQDAPNQWMILAAFQEEGWPSVISDPLPGDQDQNVKERLHQTIRNLNRAQKNRLIHFGGNGTGDGIIWRRLVVVKKKASQKRAVIAIG